MIIRVAAAAVVAVLASAGATESGEKKSSDRASGKSIEAAADATYPVVLSDVESQRRLGLAVSNFGPGDGGSALANKCYYFGDGGDLISVSDAFLAAYRSRGFTLRTLCLGLVSGILFHPETGARLATVITADLEELGSPDYIGEPGAVSGEIPVQLPDCFRRGLPLGDCRFAFDVFSGAPLDPALTRQFADAGAAVLSAGRDLLAAGKYGRPCADGSSSQSLEDEHCFIERNDEEMGAEGYFAREYWAEAHHYEMFPLGGFADFSPALPEGFGFAIFADGAAGPSASMDSADLALSGKNRATEARLDALNIVIKGK